MNTISTYAFIDKPLEACIRECAADEWKSIEVMCEFGHREIVQWPKEKLQDLKRMGIELGIQWSMHAPIAGCNPCAASSEEIERTLEIVSSTLEAANILGCGYVVLHAGEIPSDMQMEENAEQLAEERLVRFIRTLLERTKQMNVVVALENVPSYPYHVGCRTDQLIRVIQAIDSPRLQIVFDIGHAYLVTKDHMPGLLEEALPYAVALHISDNRGETDDHLAVGEGTIPYEPIIRTLSCARFDGSLVFEMKSKEAALLSVMRFDTIRRSIRNHQEGE